MRPISPSPARDCREDGHFNASLEAGTILSSRDEGQLRFGLLMYRRYSRQGKRVERL